MHITGAGGAGGASVAGGSRRGRSHGAAGGRAARRPDGAAGGRTALRAGGSAPLRAALACLCVAAILLSPALSAPAAHAAAGGAGADVAAANAGYAATAGAGSAGAANAGSAAGGAGLDVAAGTGYAAAGGAGVAVADYAAVAGAGASSVAASAGSAGVSISMQLDRRGFAYEGGQNDSLPPALLDGALHLPFRPVAEAFGAWLIYRSAPEDGSAGAAVEGAFMDRRFRVAFGESRFTLNGGEIETAGSALRLIGGSAYIPASVLDACLGTVTSLDAATGSVLVYLADDGSVKDLSELLGEIKEASIGNSYLGWMMDVPKKSLLVSSSFSGSEVRVYSDIIGALVEVSVAPSEGRRLEYFMDNRDEISDDMDVEDASIKSGGAGESGRYLEATLSDYYAAGIKRLYIRDGKLYSVAVMAYPQDAAGASDPDVSMFTGDDPYSALIATFRLRFQGGASVMDISKVADGKLAFENYIDIPESGKRVMAWSISILPTWYEMYGTVNDDIFALLGEDDRENVAVTIYKPNDIAEIDDYFRRFRSIEAANYNEELYQLVSGRTFEFKGDRALDLVYKISDGEEIHVFMERMIRSGKLVYDITLRAPEERYEEERETFAEILDSFEIGADGRGAIDTNLTKQTAAARAARLSKTDGAAAVGGEKGSWSSELPGYWAKARGSVAESYYLPVSAAFENSKNNARLEVCEPDMSLLAALYGDLAEHGLSWLEGSSRGAALESGAGERDSGDALGALSEFLLQAAFSDEYDVSGASELEEVTVGENAFLRVSCELTRDDSAFPFYGEVYLFAGKAGGAGAGAAAGTGAGTAAASGAHGALGASGLIGAAGAAEYLITAAIPQIYMSEGNMAELESFFEHFAVGPQAAGEAAGESAGGSAGGGQAAGGSSPAREPVAVG
jgi:hypothetical protein